jgi:hypothetical protein
VGQPRHAGGEARMERSHTATSTAETAIAPIPGQPALRRAYRMVIHAAWGESTSHPRTRPASVPSMSVAIAASP